MASARLNTAELSPMPNPRVRITTTLETGLRTISRKASATFWISMDMVDFLALQEAAGGSPVADEGLRRPSGLALEGEPGGAPAPGEGHHLRMAHGNGERK